MRERKKTRDGVVISNKMDKSITVEVMDRLPHPLYGKIVKSRLRLKAHDEKNECLIGDKVRVVESSPLSRTKRWRLVKILERGESAED
ncbi:30S ribosomal protein S17 [bacterium]|nr:MAG: 30S ribosomal protein S17 [bacterium]